VAKWEVQASIVRDVIAKWEIKNSSFSRGKPQGGNCCYIVISGFLIVPRGLARGDLTKNVDYMVGSQRLQARMANHDILLVGASPIPYGLKIRRFFTQRLLA